MKRWLLALCLLATVSGTVYYVVRTYRPPGAMTVIESQAMDMSAMKPPAGVMPVGVEAARRAPFAATVTYSGTVVALGDQEITARVTGRVEEIAVYPGQRVVEGQLLVRLDSAELASRVSEARAAVLEGQRQVDMQLSEWETRRREQAVSAQAVPIAASEWQEARAMSGSARIQLEAMRAEYRRTEVLLQEGGASLQELQQGRAQLAEKQAADQAGRLRLERARLGMRQAQAELQARQARSENARQSLKAARASSELRQAQLHTAEIQLGYTRITASSPAEVVERVVSPGTLVMPGQVLLRLKQTEGLRLQAQVAAQHARRIRPGLPVQANFLGKSLEARVTSVFRSADPQTRTLTVEAKVPADADLLPGAAGSMEIALEPAAPRLSIPLAALQTDAEGQKFVWKLQESSPGATAYTCVMHPEVVRPGPGKCPKCGMDLVPQRRTGAVAVTRQPVRAGSINGQRVAILSGLNAGEEVVVQGYQDLHEGMPVARVRWGLDGPMELPTPQAPVDHSAHGSHR